MRHRIPVCALFFALVFLCAGAIRAEQLLVFAAISLSDALEQIGADFERETSMTVRYNFQGSSALARQIEAGAPADLFFSADEEKMDQLVAKDLVLAGTRTALLSNRLVVVAASDDSFIDVPVDLADPSVSRIAIAQPDSVPAGIYAKQYLLRQKLWDTLAPKMIPMENVRAALAAVASGNADAGFVYATDVLGSPRIRMAYEISGGDAPAISYPVAVLRGAPNKDAACQFLAYLRSRAARGVFERYGFTVFPAQEP